MTAEIFLAVFLGCLLAILVYNVLIHTVYLPLIRWRQDQRIRKMTEARVGVSDVPYVAFTERYHAQQALLIAALDHQDGTSGGVVLAAAQRYRSVTPPREADALRSMRHLFSTRETKIE